jgi:hypothetical protein
VNEPSNTTVDVKTSTVVLDGSHSLLHNIDIIRVTRRMRLAGHVARMADRRGPFTVLVERPEGNNHLEDLDVDGRIILK